MAKVDGNSLVVKSLKDEGVDTVFYITGGPMVDVASKCIEIGFNSVDVRHEQGASMAAHAYSRVLGKPGCVLCRLRSWCHQSDYRGG